MATTTYARTTITGKITMRRERPQGRPKKDGEKRTPKSYTTDGQRDDEIIKRKAAEFGMSVARYVGFAAVMYEPNKIIN